MIACGIEPPGFVHQGQKPTFAVRLAEKFSVEITACRVGTEPNSQLFGSSFNVGVAVGYRSLLCGIGFYLSGSLSLIFFTTIRFSFSTKITIGLSPSLIAQ